MTVRGGMRAVELVRPFFHMGVWIMAAFDIAQSLMHSGRFEQALHELEHVTDIERKLAKK